MTTRNLKRPKQEIGVEGFHPVANNDHALEILRTFRDVPPAHYTFRIESFSLFLSTEYEYYESQGFEAGGYKWGLSIYPNGNKKRNVNGHLSLYLAIVDPDTLPLGWEVHVSFKLFVFDHIRDRYLTIQDGTTRRFHQMKTEWGFDKLLPLDTFSDASNGYLEDDCCVFGAEVFVIKPNGKGECMSMIKHPVNTFTWEINEVSAISEEYVSSDEFDVGKHKWKLLFYPKGYDTGKGKTLFLFLELTDCKNNLNDQVYAEFMLRIRNQANGNHSESEVLEHWFWAKGNGWGVDLLPISDFKNASKGFMVNDSVVVEVEIMFLTTLKCS